MRSLPAPGSSSRSAPLLFALAATLFSACGGSATGSGGSGGTGSGGASTGSGGTTTATSTLTLMSGQCRDTTDCQKMGGSAYCALPGAPMCGGAGCGLKTCSLDGDCQGMGGPSVCDIEPCCGDKRCIPGCTKDADCGQGRVCTPDFHCVAQPCDKTPCPENFDCGMGAVPTCARRMCASDVVCQGWCVLGACYEKPGTCELPGN
jgi:hypothetical protein